MTKRTAKTKVKVTAKPNGRAGDPLATFGLQPDSERAKVLKVLAASLGKPVPLAKLDAASLRILERKIDGDLKMRGGVKPPFKIERKGEGDKATVTLRRR